MDNDVLTLVRELKIVRDENILLKSKLEHLAPLRKQHSMLSRVSFEMVKHINYQRGHGNPKVVAAAQNIIQTYLQYRAEYSLKPMPFLSDPYSRRLKNVKQSEAEEE